MAPTPPLSWADAPPYQYHGTPLPLPKTAPPEEAAGGGGGSEEARSLWIGGLLHWMNEDYLYSCFTQVPEVLHFAFLISAPLHSSGVSVIRPCSILLVCAVSYLRTAQISISLT